MSQPVVVEYTTDTATAITSLTAVIARLGYTLQGIDRENGLITFQTGMSMKSWAGQSMSAHVLAIAPNTVQITLGGTRNVHGAQMQVYDWGEAGSIGTKIVEGLTPFLGNGRLLAGDAGSCFVATVIYGDYNASSVRILRRFRDEILAHHFLGRIIIQGYYQAGPFFALVLRRSPTIQKPLRVILDYFVDFITSKLSNR